MTAALRVAAIAIAVAGAIDPAWSLTRHVKPEVAVVASSRLPSPSLVNDVSAALESRFRVVRGPSFGAAATVLVGDDLSADARHPAPVAFAVEPVPVTPFVSIVRVDVPEQGQLHSRIPVRVGVRARAAVGRELTVVVRSRGVTIDTVSRKIAGADVTETVDLAVVASSTGRTPITVTAEITGAGDSHTVDAAVNVGNERYAVLAFDRRPSWLATFVRRSLETDPRFLVTSRVATTRGAATTAGDPPSSLASLPSLELFDAVIIGAPDELTMADATGLEAFLRRGGSVVLLLDEPASGPALEHLTGVRQWKSSSLVTPNGTPRASEFFRPATPPSWASLDSRSGGPEPGPRPEPEPVSVWSTAVGPGRLVVSGALDSWRFRDSASQPSFDEYLRLLAAQAAERSRRVPAAAEPGPESRAPVPDERPLVQAWATAHGGRVIRQDQLAELAPSLSRALAPPTELVTTYPMRSGWWIVPFGLFLGIEWWMRRRAGRT